MKNYMKILLLLAAIGFGMHDTRAAWGDFDTTFGFLGAAIDGVTSHYPLSVAVQSDGKILVTGYRLSSGRERLFLRRYLSNGQVDTSFGNNGSAISNALLNAAADYRGSKVIVQANGRIAVLGTGNGRPAIWRFTSAGSSDTSIGSGGMKTLSSHYPAGTTDAIATHLNILYVGVRTNSSPSYTVILKFNSSGSQDNSFGNAGETLTNANNFFKISVDPVTGNILIGGRHRNGVDFGIERFLTTGQRDSTFNHYDAVFDGNMLANPSHFVQLSNGQFAFNDRWIQGSGPFGFDADIFHFASNGVLGGSTHYSNDAPFTWITGSCPDILAQQQDGRLIAKTVNNDELFRFSTNFSTVQTMTCGNYSSLQSPTPAVLQSDDKMIAAGRNNGNIALVRTLP